MGSSDGQVEEYKKKLHVLESELLNSQETNKLAHEKHQEALSRATRALQATEQQHQATITRLQRELDMVKESGMGVNDALRSKDYSKTEKAEKPRAAALSSVIADEQKQKEKGKEKEKEDREERERYDRQREERGKQDREREDKDRDSQNAATKQKTAELEVKFKQLAEQVNTSLTIRFRRILIIQTAESH